MSVQIVVANIKYEKSPGVRIITEDGNYIITEDSNYIIKQ